MGNRGSGLRLAEQLLRGLKRALGRSVAAPPSRTSDQRPFLRTSGAGESPGQSGPGATRDLTPEERKALAFEYAPQPDGDPDPGEVVWTWVPYVENDGRGKDRPVLIIARLNGSAVVGCHLTTKPHAGYVNIGAGGWDPQGRDSFLSPERLLRVTNSGMRREGHLLDRDRFVEAARAIARRWNLRP